MCKLVGRLSAYRRALSRPITPEAGGPFPQGFDKGSRLDLRHYAVARTASSHAVAGFWGRRLGHAAAESARCSMLVELRERLGDETAIFEAAQIRRPLATPEAYALPSAE